MSTNTDHELEKRVLLVAPTAKDAQVTHALLTTGGLTCVICENIRQLNEQVEKGAGAVLLTEEAITADDIGELLRALNRQPAWSELPVVMLMRGGVESPVASRVLRSLRNVTLLERPAPMRSVVSAVQVAVRGRQRQYQMREQIEKIRRAELRARELQQQLEIAIDASELGTFHCEMPLNKIIWNDRCKAHFWLPPEAEVDFDLFYSILHPDDRERTRKAVEECVKDGKLYDIEYRTVSPRGQIRWVRATGRTYYNERREPLRFDGTTQDITERKNAEQERNQLLESERAARQEAERAGRMKDEFLATLSHELRTPLNAIFGWTQLLKRGKDDSEIVAEGIDVIDRNVRMQTQLIEDLLDMSRIVSGKVRLDVQQVDLPEVIDAALQGVQPAADAKGICLERVIDPAAGPVSGDPGRLQQVLWNLLTNAIKFTPRDGRIHVLLQRVDSHVQISVTDTGEGISPEFLPHLFERFSQADASMRRKHGGLGIGLSLVKSLVELHGGTVRAASRGEGSGATFTIDLPLRPARDQIAGAIHPRSSRVSAEEMKEPPKLRGVKVLVVDDEPDARELVRRMLIERQAVPRLASSAKEAQEILLDFKPDVILSDIGMPSQDGYEFMREVRGRGDCTPAIALTAFARSEDRIRSIQAGYQTYLPKPVEAVELLAVIASLARPSGNGNHA
jgi:signal transduction histidine kinase/DNA-binding response OmpR family regulator